MAEEKKQYTRTEFAGNIKKNYPEYASVDDNRLVDKWLAKYPGDSEYLLIEQPPIDVRQQQLDSLDAQNADLITEYKKRTSVIPIGMGAASAGLQAKQGLNEWDKKPQWEAYQAQREAIGKDVFKPTYSQDELGNMIGSLERKKQI